MTDFDPTRLEATCRATGPAFVRRMREVFERSAERAIDTLAAATDCGEDSETRRAAHTLKGSAATVGLTRLERAAAMIEARARGDHAATDDDVEGLRRELVDGLAAMDRWIADLDDG